MVSPPWYFVLFTVGTVFHADARWDVSTHCWVSCVLMNTSVFSVLASANNLIFIPFCYFQQQTLNNTGTQMSSLSLWCFLEGGGRSVKYPPDWEDTLKPNYNASHNIPFTRRGSEADNPGLTQPFSTPIIWSYSPPGLDLNSQLYRERDMVVRSQGSYLQCGHLYASHFYWLATVETAILSL